MNRERNILTPRAFAEVGSTSGDRLAPGTKLVLGILVVSTFVVVLNETIMNVALATLIVDLGISAATAQWLTTAYLLTMAIVIPVSGFLLQRFTVRQLFITAMSLFTIGTLVAALSSGFAMLLSGRIVQAAGAAVMMPLLMTAVMHSVPARRRGSIMGTISIVTAAAPALGPAVSGAVLSVLDWPFLFWTVLPIAMTTLLIGIFRLRNVTQTRRVRIDVLSVILSVFAFGGILFGLVSIGESANDVTHINPLVPLIVGAAFLLVFIIRQRYLAHHDLALLDLRTFRTPQFSWAIIVTGLVAMTLFGTLTVLPLYLQSVLGIGPFATGLLLLPGGVLLAVLSPLVGSLYDRGGIGPLIMSGAVLLALSQFAFVLALAQYDSSLSAMIMFTVMHIALAFLFTPLMTVALSSLPAVLYSHGSATFSTVQQLAGAAGTATLVTLMTVGSTRAGGESNIAAGVRDAYIGASVIAVIAVISAAVLVLLVRRRRSRN
ncbi:MULTISPECIES: DHA2 family efflux MFS transporter permease subunit [Pectobacteriaceae]|uniref:DHA2 family efflux MFS transporter permease subunit n=1 Tax=Affinibrenneria salicis TaxID=2590031 RepID=A0A5J5FSR4_9GAMM|nr:MULTISPECIES: DHA2 family efflux MFS transporter permease subunit [Pectobacteriaceae]MEE3644450.1 DHA2 family efflux MFS transporter permease subunit [Brenneria sp. L3_3C_1]MEE3652012.1 DHA2 family efflux MFS transporter permease subunit [Brenneria sp. HEZEL_4_2_4]MEE3663642.1 DHA2 family efflux MFS transporter permease subunit [Brenneria sp. g21c3]KAA8995899.1 DHA2 family efflux MFS transporter permease subunit [Affinibrenneria salicis]MBJ7223208.1 DHA2 family efflux MFS transporter permea